MAGYPKGCGQSSYVRGNALAIAQLLCLLSHGLFPALHRWRHVKRWNWMRWFQLGKKWRRDVTAVLCDVYHVSHSVHERAGHKTNKCNR